MQQVEELQCSLQEAKDEAFLQKNETAKASVSTISEKHNAEQI